MRIREQEDFIPYDYIIIDEAQDVLDKGAIQLLNSLTSVTFDGLATGRYLVFFDKEQGYNNKNRPIDEIADSVALNGARFILDENKRVPTNKIIISFANKILEGVSAKSLFKEIELSNSDCIKVLYFDGAKTLIRHINGIKKEIREHSHNWEEYVVLADSSTKYEQVSNAENLYDRIATVDGIKELSPLNICAKTNELPFTSMLAFKGLESKHVILVVNGRANIDTFELYIGMTRAIIDLQILILQ